MKKLFLVLMFCSALLFVGNSAFAIPTLGVAPGAPGSSGTYLGSSSGADYLTVFADNFLGTGDGFVVPSTGSFDITIWYGSNNSGGVPTDVDIYLATDAADGGSFKWNGDLFSSNAAIGAVDISTADYKDPTFGYNLGPANADGWAPFNSLDPTVAGDFYGKNFYYLTGTIDVGSSLEPGEWLYAVADINGNGGITGGEFSPKTTASTVPEPTTLLLLGSGLFGLAGFGRKKIKK